MTMLGFVLYASLMLLPIFLQTLLGYPALQSGLALSPRGIGVAGFDAHHRAAHQPLSIRASSSPSAFSSADGRMFSLSHLNLNAGYWDIFWPQVIQGGAMAFLFIPLMATSMSGIAREKMGNATSIYNLMRNIGGSFGIATHDHLPRPPQPGSPEPARQPHHALGSRHAEHGARDADVVPDARPLIAYDAQHKAMGAIYGMVQQQAAMLSFVEAFWVMGVIFLGMLPLVLLLRNARDLHPHEKKPVEMPSAVTIEEHERELVGVGSD